MMKWMVNLAAFFFLIWMSACSLYADETGKLSAEILTAELDRVTTVLNGVVDQESARAADEALRQFRTSPFSSRDPDVRRQVQQLLDEDENLNQAFFKNHQELQRIEELGGDVFSMVIESLTGEKPINLVAHIEKTAGLLDQIKTRPDLDRLENDLREAWKPIADMMRADLEGAVDRLENDPALQEAMDKQKEAVAQLNQRDPELARKARNVMMGEELIMEIEEQVANNLEKTKVNLAISGLMGAILNFEAEMDRFPLLLENGGKDLIVSSDAALIDVLTGVDKKANPKGVRYLDAGLVKGGVVYDPWGKRFRVIMDTNRDDEVALPEEYGGRMVSRMILIDSAGPDGDFQTIEDNVFSWPEE